METKLEKLKKMWAAGDYRAALKLAASWPRLGIHKNTIQQGWAAISNQDFYQQIGKDPLALYVAGLKAVSDRYVLPPPRTCSAGVPGC